ncbi:unnamed protein product, partial [Linum tenue]
TRLQSISLSNENRSLPPEDLNTLTLKSTSDCECASAPTHLHEKTRWRPQIRPSDGIAMPASSLTKRTQHRALSLARFCSTHLLSYASCRV